VKPKINNPKTRLDKPMSPAAAATNEIMRSERWIEKSLIDPSITDQKSGNPWCLQQKIGAVCRSLELALRFGATIGFNLGSKIKHPKLGTMRGICYADLAKILQVEILPQESLPEQRNRQPVLKGTLNVSFFYDLSSGELRQ